MLQRIRKTVCAAIAGVMLMTMSVTAQAATVNDFKDVSPGAWYYPAVEWAAENGLFAGTSSTTFSPEAGMTRGMFVTVLGRRSGVDTSKIKLAYFADIWISDWYGPYVEWAASYDIVSGVGENRFAPDQQISREQMAAILYRYAEKTKNDTTKDLANLGKFPDSSKVSSYARDAMAWAVTHGILKGMDGKLNPQGTATRAQVAQVFKNAEGVLTKKEIKMIELSAEMKARLDPHQDPEEVVRRVLRETTAQWDDNLADENTFTQRIMHFGMVQKDEFSDPDTWQNATGHAAFNAVQYINATGTDRFCIVPFQYEHKDGEPYCGLELRFSIPEKTDSAVMTGARRIIEQKYPSATFTPEALNTGCGWRGYVRADDDLSTTENAKQIAEWEIHYLDEWYDEDGAFNYWISEPELGKFYFYY